MPNDSETLPQTAPIASRQIHLGTPPLVRAWRGAVTWLSGGSIVARDVTGQVVSQPKTRTGVRIPYYLISFLGLVVLPTIAAQLYLAFVASDEFVAEARFAVRENSSESSSSDMLKTALSSMSSSTGSAGGIPSQAGQDAFIITSYVHSRAIIDDLAKELDVKTIFRRPGADFWARLKNDATAEEVLDYWNSMISTNVDGPSGIVTVKTRAFRPDDALALCQAITRLSETLANTVSARMRKDVTRRAEQEVSRSEGLVRAALQEMRQFRDKEGFLDPVSAAESTGKLMLESIAQKIGIENDLFVAERAMSANAPTLQVLRARLTAVDKQIDQMKNQMTSNAAGGQTLSGALVKFEELELKRIFSEKLYTMAQDALAQARRKAERQNIYVSTFVSPSLPEYARYPERLSLSIIIPVGLCVLWGIMALLAAAVNDHRL